MAPFPIDLLHPQPDLQIRQDGASPFIVTLSITRATTTYTTTIILGSATDTPSNPTTTGTTITTASPTQILIPATSPESSDRGAIIGGVLGAFLGFFVLAALFWKCCYDNRSALWVNRRRSSYSDSDSDSTTSSRSSHIRRRGGGGSGFGRRNRRGDGIRRPRRAYVRRERDTSGSRSGTRSSISKSERYGRNRRGSGGGMMSKNGVFGWPLGAIIKPRYVETREKVRWSSSGKGSGHGHGNLRFNVGDD